MSEKILAVDDSRTVLEQLERALAPHAFALSTASDGASALTAAAAEPFDLVIVDVNMPGMNGLELITELRKLPGYADTPIFVLTTESTRELVERGKEVGATAWIVKPFDPALLIKGIQQILGKR